MRSLRTGQKVDEHTMFGIACNSKAFTAAALGMLVDEKKIKCYRGSSFVVRWADRELDADAFVNVALGADGKPVGMTMAAVSPLTDFSFDFQDLQCQFVKSEAADVPGTH